MESAEFVNNPLASPFPYCRTTHNGGGALTGARSALIGVKGALPVSGISGGIQAIWWRWSLTGPPPAQALAVVILALGAGLL